MKLDSLDESAALVFALVLFVCVVIYMMDKN
jgi:hypothetical protein